MATSLSVAASVAGRIANDTLEHQVNKVSAIHKELSKNAINSKGKTYSLNISNGTVGSAGLVANSGSLPTASSLTPEHVNVTPQGFFCNVKVGEITAELADGSGDGLDIWAENVASAGEELGYNLGRACLDGYIGGLNGTVSSLAITATLDDVGGVREGMNYEGGSDHYSPTSVSDSATSAGGSVVFTTDASDGAVAVELYLDGWGANSFVSLADASGSGTIYGTAISSTLWQGVQNTSVGAMTDAKLLDMVSRVNNKCIAGVSHVVMSEANWRELNQSRGGSGFRRFNNPTAQDDMFGDIMQLPTIMGAKLVVDRQCPNAKAFAFSGDKVKMIKFDNSAGDKFRFYGNSIGRGYDVSFSTFDRQAGFYKLCQLGVKQRSGIGAMTGITIS